MLGIGLAAVKSDVSKKAKFADALRQVSANEKKLIGIASKSLTDSGPGSRM